MLSPNLRKEIRQMAPTAAAALLLPIIVGFPPTAGPLLFKSLSIPLVAIGSSLIAISVFGKEISGGTLSAWFALPESRTRRCWEKVSVAGSLLAFLAVIFCAVFHFHRGSWEPEESRFAFGTYLLWPWCALGVGVFLTLTLGHPVGAFWLTMLLPVAVATALISLWPRLQFGSDEPPGWVWLAVFAFYGAVGLWLAWRRLHRWQDTGFGAREISFVWDRRPKENEQISAPRPRGPLRALLRKELNLQQMNLAMLIVLLALFFGGVWMARNTKTALDDLPALLARVLWFILPFTVGAIAVAEERRAHVMEWQHSLPLSRNWQWVIKAAICFGLSLAIAFLAGAIDRFVTTSLKDQEWAWWWPLFLGGWHVGGTAFGLYASSLSRNFIQGISLVAGVVTLLLGCTGLTAWLVGYFRYWWSASPHCLFALVVGVVFVPLLLILGGRNYRELQIRAPTWRINAGAGLVAAAVCMAVTAAIYLRTWELFTLREPPAGPSIVRPGTVPSVDKGWGMMMAPVLGPDGRLRVLSSLMIWDEDEEEWVRRPDVDADWALGQLALPEGHWQQIASTSGHLFTLKDDGSLWRARIDLMAGEIVDLEPVAAKQLWKAITAGPSSPLLAIAQDGSLWQWVESAKSDGLGAEATWNPMLEVIPGSRWKGAVVGGELGFGIRDDGSLWTWGNSLYRRELLGAPASSEPTRVGTETDWDSFGAGAGWTPIVRKTDGSYWVLRRDLYFVDVPQDTNAARWTRIGHRADWTKVVFSYHDFHMIRKDGSHWRGTSVRYDRGANTLMLRERRVGRRHDWVALGLGFGLTADGKIWDWDTDRWGYPRRSRFVPPRFRSKVVADLTVPVR